ncbi:MAG TPA: FAD-binding oxidoreductase [Casimicrobiaceae bacterium]|nr:FAD-binding oxidoreductase [Casimicrobiaceae bacterium]
MTTSAATLLARLAEAVGDAQVLTATADTEPFLVDQRGRFRGAARAVVRPANTLEVAAVVRACADANVPLVAQGGNTGMCGAATPDASGTAVVVSLARMRKIRALDRDNATITVEAGATLAEVQRAAADADLLFPLSLASEGSCTIGGNIATNAGGTAVLRYGNMRELVLGIEAVLADGRVWNGLRGLRKDNTGYDLKQLFIGSEGTLGIVTAAVLKLFPSPRTRVTALAAMRDVAQAVALLRRMKQALGDRLVGFELMSGAALGVSRAHHPELPDPLPGHRWYVLVQADDSTASAPLATVVEAALGQAAEDGVVADATVAQSGDQAARLWALRENISESQRREGPNIKHDISLPVSAIPAFIEATGPALAAAFADSRLVVFGHLGDGNLHYNVAAPRGASAQAFMDNTPDVNRIVHDRVVAAGGSISAEHGIGQLKRDELAHYKPALDIDLMRCVKAALDPRGLLNPGKVLP